jgi:sphingomyelin phosphodiesterase acid-like 3
MSLMRNWQRYRKLQYILLVPAIAALPSVEVAAKPPSHTFLIVSDIHFNPMADAGLVDELMKADPPQWESILDQTKPAAFSQYGEDTNWWLLRSALEAMRSTLPQPAFILVTGDLLAHQFPDTFRRTAHDGSPQAYRRFVRNTVEFLALQLRLRFPRATILPTPGNNDDDCGDYQIAAGGPFLQDTAGIVRKLARGDDELERSWKELGTFDVRHPVLPKTRILSLNTIFFSEKYRAANFNQGCAVVSSTAPADLLSWLQARLDHAKKAHEKVWLMLHIPPGMDGYSTIERYESLLKTGQPPAKICPTALVPMWAPEWTAKFDELLARYAGTVIVSLSGHTHTDDFRVISGSDRPAFVLINPPISPVYNQNPAFRVATFAQDASLIDDSVYYLTNLIYASKTTSGQWAREYDFAREWKMRGVNAANLGTIYSNIQQDGVDRATWLKLYNVSSSAAHLPQAMIPGLYCAIEGLTPEAYGQCFCSAVVH